MNTQKRLNMNIGNYTKTLRDDLRKGLLITLTLLLVCPGVWGQVTQPAGSGTEGSPYQITSAENLAWVCSHGGYAKLYQSLEGSINFTEIVSRKRGPNAWYGYPTRTGRL